MSKILRLRRLNQKDKIELSKWVNRYLIGSGRDKPKLLEVIRSNIVIGYMKEVGMFDVVKQFIDSDRNGINSFKSKEFDSDRWRHLEPDRKYAMALFGSPKQSSKLTRILKYSKDQDDDVEPVAWNYIYHLREHLYGKFGRNPDLQLNRQNYLEGELQIDVGIYLLKRFSTLDKRRIGISELRIIELPDYKKPKDEKVSLSASDKKMAWTFTEERYGKSDEGEHLTKVKGRIVRSSENEFNQNFHFIGTGIEYLKTNANRKDFSDEDIIDSKVYESMILKKSIKNQGRLEGLLISNLRKTGEPFCTKVIADFFSNNLSDPSDVELLREKVHVQDLESSNDFFELENAICPERRMLII